jgi:hypothetical protein
MVPTRVLHYNRPGKCLNHFPNFVQPLREQAVGTTRGHAKGETPPTSKPYQCALFESGLGRPLQAQHPLDQLFLAQTLKLAAAHPALESAKTASLKNVGNCDRSS